MSMLDWKRCSNTWILKNEVMSSLDWRDGGASNTAALMCLSVIIHRSDAETGVAIDLKYEVFQEATHRSRTSIANGLAVLKERKTVDSGSRQSEYSQQDYPMLGKPGWAKFPYRSMYKWGEDIVGLEISIYENELSYAS